MMLRLVFLFLLAGTAPVASATDAPADSSPLAQEEFVALVGRELAAHFKLDGELHLDLMRPWTAPAAVARTWEVSVVTYPAAPASSMLLRCRLLADRVPVGEVNVMLRAAYWREAWVARAPLAYGATFDPAQLETRQVDFLRERDAVPTSIGERNFIFARTVSAGRTLTWRDLTRRPLVRRGQVVEVSAVDGALLVTMKAVAMENGAEGDTVTVRNPESQRNFSATVTDENRVQVRF